MSAPTPKPALTPDEWHRMGARQISLSIGRGERETFAAGALPAMMALSNAALPLDSPYKITLADVTMLRRHAIAMERPDAWDAGAPFARLADKLAALLQP